APCAWWRLSKKMLEQVQPSGKPRKPGSLLLQARLAKHRSRVGVETALSDPLKEDDTCVPMRSSCVYRTKYVSYLLLRQVFKYIIYYYYEIKSIYSTEKRLCKHRKPPLPGSLLGDASGGKWDIA